MAKSRTTRAAKLVVTLDAESRALIVRAAALRRISVSEYLCQVASSQARKDVIADFGQPISMTADEQRTFWKALNAPVRLTSMQKRLGQLTRVTSPPARLEH